jgi:hypothetical protein
MLDQVEVATREPFLAAKAELDARLAARFGVAVDGLSPWHYGDLFFQRYDGDPQADGLGPLLEGSDTVALTVAAYHGMAWRPSTCWSDPTCTVTSSVRLCERLLAGTPVRGSAPQPGLRLGSGVVGPATRGWSCGASHAHACA